VSFVKIGEGEGHTLRKCINNILLSILYCYSYFDKTRQRRGSG